MTIEERVRRAVEEQQMRDEYHAMETRVAELELENEKLREKQAQMFSFDTVENLETERDRLREALKDLAEEAAPLLPNGSYELRIARAALQEAWDESAHQEP